MYPTAVRRKVTCSTPVRNSAEFRILLNIYRNITTTGDWPEIVQVTSGYLSLHTQMYFFSDLLFIYINSFAKL